MANKENLNKMIDSILDNNTEQAQTYFHTFIKDKMSELITPKPTDSNKKTNGE